MAEDEKISALAAKTTVHDNDLFPIVDLEEADPANQTKKITGANMKSQMTSAHAALTTGVHGAGGDILATDADISIHAGDETAHHPPAHYETEDNLSFYVDATAGSDGNDGSESTPFQTIAYVINLIPKLIKHEVTVYLKRGETWSESLELMGFRLVAKGAKLIITRYGASGDNPKVTDVFVKHCVGDPILIGYIDATTTTNDAFRCDASNAVRLTSCSATGSAASHYGILAAYGAVVWANACTMSNKEIGILASAGGIIYSQNNSGTGNDYGVYAVGGYVSCEGTQPTGTVNRQTNTPTQWGLLTPVPNFSVSRNANQAITTGTNTKIEYDTTGWDIGSYWDSVNYRYTPKEKGKYLFIACTQINGLGDAKEMYVMIYKNGVFDSFMGRMAVGAACSLAMQGSRIIDLDGEDDYVEMFVYHSHGSDRNLWGGSERNWLQGHKIMGA